ncbi:2OG-Fe(II) oxygenase family protein [Skermanella mucosa]|uniref:TIGR02466 family protein n=1 Tax=Skermanella mucosa TaxID=1789672 RepID=UPI00192B6DDC|nr:TIGR02466 family protein [Skermanella mucosa]UEM22701.1 2OG-Fe(II) oxygenase family protein [Skermanella mucosa]
MQSIKLNEAVMYCFGTPLFKARIRDHAAMNADLAAYLRKERDATPDKHMSAVRGWQGRKDLFEQDHPALNRLKGQVAKAVIAVTQTYFGQQLDPAKCFVNGEMWGNIIPNGGYTKLHNHSKSHWSGVYYIDVDQMEGDWPENGCIEFVDPRSFPTAFHHPKFSMLPSLTIKPENGLMLLFPGWLNHYVHPYHGPAERISIAFNAMIRVDD